MQLENNCTATSGTIYTDYAIRILMAFMKRHCFIVLLPMHFSWYSQVMFIVRHVLEACKIRMPCFVLIYY